MTEKQTFPRRWERTVDIKVYLDPEQDWREVARNIANRLEKAGGFDEDGFYFVEEFRDVADDPETTVEDLDCILAILYDYADHWRIWLGFK